MIMNYHTKNKQKNKEKKKNEWYTNGWLWVIITLLVLILVHCMFSFPAPSEFFSAKWGAGDILILIGTLLLGFVAISQTQRANKTAEEAAKVSKALLDKELAEVKPFIDVRQLTKTDTKSLSVERSIKVSTELNNRQYYCRLNNDFSIIDEKGETFYFGIKNVCNHDILGIKLQQIKMACFNNNLEELNFGTSICVGSMASGELTALILSVPSQYFIQAAAKDHINRLKTENSVYISLHLRFDLLNTDGQHYSETVKLRVINAEQSGLYFPVILEKDLRPLVKE